MSLIQQKIDSDPDFVNLKRFDYSLSKALERYPEGLPNNLIAIALDIPESKVEDEYQRIVLKIREDMGIVI